MLYLHGLGHWHPANEIDNAFLESLDIGTNEEWIVERTGIRSRRTVLPLDYIFETRNRDLRAADEAADSSNAELGARAAEMAIERAGIDREQIGMIIGAGSVPATVTPAEGCAIGAALGLEVPALDVRSACTSFGAAMYLLSLMESGKLPDFVLIAAPESCTRAVDYDDRNSAVLWGDAGAAAVVSTRVPGRARVSGNTMHSSPKGHDKVVVPWAKHFRQEGATVQSFAIKKTVRLLRAMQEEHRDLARERFHFVGHQANLLMLENVCRSCGIADSEHLSNVADYGNTATAGAPSVLSMQWERFEAGDHVAVIGVGAGLTWSGMMLHFEA